MACVWVSVHLHVSACQCLLTSILPHPIVHPYYRCLLSSAYYTTSLALSSLTMGMPCSLIYRAYLNYDEAVKCYKKRPPH